MRDHLVDHDDWKRAEREHVRELERTDVRATELEALEEDAAEMSDGELSRLRGRYCRDIARRESKIEKLQSEKRHLQSMRRIVERALED